MSKIILFLLLATVSRYALAEWVEVQMSADNTITIYADPSTIIKSGNMAGMWDLGDFKEAQDSGEGTKLLSIKSHSEYDCTGGQYRTLYTTYFSKNMAQGDVIGSYKERGTWMPVRPGSLHASLLNYACGK